MLLPMAAAAQGHLDYEGIPIDGNISGFSKALQEKGMVFKEKMGNNYVFTGEDSMGNNYYVTVGCTPEENGAMVYQVVRMTDAMMNFSDLEREYKKWQRKFDKKYGEGNYDEFIDSQYDDDDMGRYVALQIGKGRYQCEYIMNSGEVTLMIVGANHLAYVAMAFIDRQNRLEAEKYLTE